MARDQNARVSLTYRLPEWLRAKLESAAKANDLSINLEITRRIEWTFEEENSFGSRDTALIARLVGAAVQATELQMGKSCRDGDPAVGIACRAAAMAVLGLLIPPPQLPDMLSGPADEVQKTRAAFEVGHLTATKMMEDEMVRIRGRMFAEALSRTSDQAAIKPDDVDA